MDLFVCEKCNTVDAVMFAYPEGLPTKQPVKLECTECQTGHWHHLFEQEKYKPGFDIVINRPNDLGLG